VVALTVPLSAAAASPPERAGTFPAFKGWLQAPSGPAHAVAEGDAVALAFRSAVRTVRYQVCVERRAGGFLRCRSRTAVRARTSWIPLSTTLLDPCGAYEAPFSSYTATWASREKVADAWRSSWGSEGV
jgi:hypothetical protein